MKLRIVRDRGPNRSTAGEPMGGTLDPYRSRRGGDSAHSRGPSSLRREHLVFRPAVRPRGVPPPPFRPAPAVSVAPHDLCPANPEVILDQDKEPQHHELEHD